MGDRVRGAGTHPPARGRNSRTPGKATPISIFCGWSIFPCCSSVAEEGRWAAVHHPFTRPKDEDIPCWRRRTCDEFGPRLTTWSSTAWRSAAAACGSTKPICRPECSTHWESSAEQQEAKFGHILKAFRFGAPAPWRHRAGSGPSGDAGLRRNQHPRSDRVPEEQPGRRSHVFQPFGGRLQAASGTVREIDGGRKEEIETTLAPMEVSFELTQRDLFGFNLAHAWRRKLIWAVIVLVPTFVVLVNGFTGEWTGVLNAFGYWSILVGVFLLFLLGHRFAEHCHPEPHQGVPRSAGASTTVRFRKRDRSRDSSRA